VNKHVCNRRRGRRGEICQQDLSIRVETRTLGRPLHPNPRKSKTPAPQQPPADRKPTNPSRHAAHSEADGSGPESSSRAAEPHQARCHPGRAHRRGVSVVGRGEAAVRGRPMYFPKSIVRHGHAERARGRHSAAHDSWTSRRRPEAGSRACLAKSGDRVMKGQVLAQAPIGLGARRSCCSRKRSSPPCSARGASDADVTEARAALCGAKSDPNPARMTGHNRLARATVGSELQAQFREAWPRWWRPRAHRQS